MTIPRKLGVSGSISGWDNYSTDTTPSAVGPEPEVYTIPEILDLVRAIRRDFNPKILEKLMLLMEEHVHNTQNPHKLTLASLNTSVITELYKEWLAYGCVGTSEDFLKVLFQYVEIADLETTKAGISSAKLVSVKGAKYLYDEHIADAYAHEEMFRHMFPGHSIDDIPVFSAQAFIGVPEDTIVERDSVCLFHTPAGNLSSASANTLPIDYIYGEPMFSIWGARTNMVTYSPELGSGTFIGGSRTQLVSTKTPGNVFDGVIFKENNTDVTSENGWMSDQYSFTEGVVYTASCYILPLSKSFISITLPEELAGPAYPIHSLVQKDLSYIPFRCDTEYCSGEAIILNNEWVRVILSFKAKVTMSASVKFLFCDQLDGDVTHIGTGVEAGAFWQAQIEEGLGASPPILTGRYAVQRPATIVRVPFADRFNSRSGTIVVTTKKPKNLQQVHAHTLYDMGTSEATVICGRYPITHAGRLYMESFNQVNEVLNSTWSGDADRELITYMHSYDIGYHTYGNTGNTAFTQTLMDNTTTFSAALNHVMSELLPEAKDTTAQVIAYDFDTTLIPSSTSIDTLPNASILTIILGQVYNKIKFEKDQNDLAVVDFLEDSDLSYTVLLNAVCDQLFVGCNKQGTEQLNGYIKDITYYARYCDVLVAEFLTGEYVSGT